MIKGKTVGLIAAVDISGMIGYGNTIPWKCSADMKRFKVLTMGSTLVMGRKTFESLPPKGLPGRTIHVLHNTMPDPGFDLISVSHFTSIVKAIESAPTDAVWIAGGAQIYREALLLNIPDFIDLSIINGLTLGPIEDNFETRKEKTVNMPVIPYTYRMESETVNPDDPKLWHRKYVVREEWAWKD